MLSALCGLIPAAWAQTGPAATARIYAACRMQADAAFQSERHIDQDILATRGSDWQRAGTLSRRRSDLFAEAAGRADTVLALCLRSYGIARAG